MAEKEKPARKSGPEEFYGERKKPDAKKPEAKKDDKEAGAEPTRTSGKPLNASDMLGRHADEREGVRKQHEAERRDEHTRQRDEHRAMNSRHEDEHGGAADHPAMVAMHRRHENEKHALRSDHMKRHHDMMDRHHAERHAMNSAHEAEMAGAEGAAGNAQTPPEEVPEAA